MPDTALSAAQPFFRNAGELGDRICGFDWSVTAIGALADWPVEMKSVLAFVLRSPTPIVTLWGDKGVMIYNDAYRGFAGNRHPELLGSNVLEGWHEVADFNANVLQKVYREGGTLTYRDQELTLVRDGTPRVLWTDLEYSPAIDADGKVLGVIAIVIETTERVVAQQRATAEYERGRVNAERVNLALEAGAIIGTWFWDLPTDRFTVDAAFAESFGLNPALGHSGIPLEQIIATVHPDERDGLLAAINVAVAAGGPYAHQYRVRRIDGRYYWIEANGRVYHDADGTPRSFPGVLIDVEDRRAVEAERDNAFAMLRSLNDELEQRVSARTAELVRTEDALRQSQKIEAIGQLTGGVAHDFNNLLTIIRSSAELLSRRELSRERQKRYIDAIADTADRAARLTGQLLAFARRQALRPEVFDVQARVSDIADMLRSVVGARIELVVDAAIHPCFVEVDASQFETALVNMAVNARDAMGGEGRLLIDVSAIEAIPAVRGHSGAQGEFVKVSVTDDGSGIEPDNLDRIFEPFYTTKEVGKGTGLGLSQVFGFTKQSGGDINVMSKRGHGTTFDVYLPRVSAPEMAGQRAIWEPILTAEAAILIVEDNEQVREFASQLLDDLGYNTSYAGNAHEALKILEHKHDAIDIVFSDVIMPGIDGVELGRQVRARWPGITVVLTSGYSHVLADDAHHGFALLQKPYSVDELSRVLTDARKAGGSVAPATRTSADMKKPSPSGGGVGGGVRR